MNLNRGVALIGLAAVCCGAAPETVNSLAKKSGSRLAIVGLPRGGVTVQIPASLSPTPFPKALDPWKVLPNVIGPKPQFGNAGPGFIPTEFHARTELIPTHWPTTTILPINGAEAHP